MLAVSFFVKWVFLIFCQARGFSYLHYAAWFATYFYCFNLILRRCCWCVALVTRGKRSKAFYCERHGWDFWYRFRQLFHLGHIFWLQTALLTFVVSLVGRALSNEIATQNTGKKIALKHETVYKRGVFYAKAFESLLLLAAGDFVIDRSRSSMVALCQRPWQERRRRNGSWKLHSKKQAFAKRAGSCVLFRSKRFEKYVLGRQDRS